MAVETQPEPAAQPVVNAPRSARGTGFLRRLTVGTNVIIQVALLAFIILLPLVPACWP